MKQPGDIERVRSLQQMLNGDSAKAAALALHYDELKKFFQKVVTMHLDLLSGVRLLTVERRRAELMLLTKPVRNWKRACALVDLALAGAELLSMLLLLLVQMLAIWVSSPSILVPILSACILVVVQLSASYWLMHGDFSNYEKIKDWLVRKQREALQPGSSKREFSPVDLALLDIRAADLRKFMELALEEDEWKVMESIISMECNAVYYPAGVEGALMIKCFY